VLLALMVVGGCAGSTAGGLKVVRALVAAKYASRHIRLAVSPRLVIPVRLDSQVLSDRMVSTVVGIVFIYALGSLAGFILMCALGLDIVSALSATLACISNVGPGMGMVGPVQNYAFIPAVGKLGLTLLMLIGRLEFVSVLALLYPMFWRWR
jgi:trk system potassium uptake protein TrkH